MSLSELKLRYKKALGTPEEAELLEMKTNELIQGILDAEKTHLNWRILWCAFGLLFDDQQRDEYLGVSRID